MSKMSELVLDIEELLGKGLKAITVAALLNVPIDMVYSVQDEMINEMDEIDNG